MSLASAILRELNSRPRKIQAQFYSVAGDSSYRPLLLMPDIVPKGLLYPYLHQNIQRIPNRKDSRMREIQPGKGIPDCLQDAEIHSVDNKTSIGLRDGDTLVVGEVKAAVRSSLKTDRDLDLSSHVPVGRRVASSPVPFEVLGSIRKE